MEKIRLQKYLAQQGIASRRKCETFIIQGKVKINNIITTQLGTKIDPKKDKIEVNGVEIKKDKIEKKYILLNKPIGYITTVKDQYTRKTVLDLVKEIKIRLVPVGRLDMYTSGALLLTNDGEFTYKITHPKHEIKKTYIVTLEGIISRNDIQELQKGVDIGDYITKPAKVKILSTNKEKKITKLEIIIHEGKNRQVRRMCEAINKKVIALHRAKIADIEVGNLKIGTWRYLTKEEINSLYK
ncbi:MAG: rRNA pseudouridine synthase [Clostridia bacterium]|jgi:23S rRNA pseudouridine2605 synthase|nr:rRNA pseudouridine synthase [Clostridia bacterium]